MRISKIAPSAPFAREMARPIKTGQRPLFRVVPPLMWRARFAKLQTSLADLSLMASLDIEVSQYTSYKVRIKKVGLSLLGGDIKALADIETTTWHSPGDQLSYLYKATPDLGPDGTPALGSKGHIMTLDIEADILVSDDCQPHVAIQWNTAVDFANEQTASLIKTAHRLSSASHAGSVKGPDALPAHDTQEANIASNMIKVTMTISGPPSVRVEKCSTGTSSLSTAQTRSGGWPLWWFQKGNETHTDRSLRRLRLVGTALQRRSLWRLPCSTRTLCTQGRRARRASRWSWCV